MINKHYFRSTFMNNYKLKILTIALFAVPIIFTASYSGVVTNAMPIADDDSAAVYKAKCAMCHSPKAEKHFDAALADEHHVKAILEGQKGEKPPFMPAFKDKGIDAAKAQALVAYMRSLRTPPAE